MYDAQTAQQNYKQQTLFWRPDEEQLVVELKQKIKPGETWATLAEKYNGKVSVSHHHTADALWSKWRALKQQRLFRTRLPIEENSDLALRDLSPAPKADQVEMSGFVRNTLLDSFFS